MVALAVLIEDQHLTRLAEQYNQAGIRLAAANARLARARIAYTRASAATDRAAAQLRTFAIASLVLDTGGGGETMLSVAALASAGHDDTDEIRLHYEEALDEREAGALRALEASQAMRAQDVEIMGAAEHEAAGELKTVRDAQANALLEILAGQELLGAYGGNLLQLIAEVEQMQFGGPETPAQAAEIALLEAQIAAESAPPPGSGPGAIAVFTAEKQLGLPYVWGGAGPHGFDCSGLTMVAWASAGVHLEHSAAAQYIETTEIAPWDIQPGDLLFYDFSGTENPADIDHVVMYIGDGLVIQAAYTGTDIMITPVFTNDLIGIGRPVAPGGAPVVSAGTPPPPGWTGADPGAAAPPSAAGAPSTTTTTTVAHAA